MSYALLLIDSTTARSRLVELGQVFIQRRGEGMVRADVALFLLVIFEQREVDDPDPGVFGRWRQLQIAGHLQAKLAEHLVDDLGLVRGEGEQIAFLGAGAFDQFRRDRCEELGDAGVEARGGDLRHGQALGAETLRPFGQGVGFLAGHFAAAGDDDGLDHRGVFEDAEIGRLGRDR